MDKTDKMMSRMIDYAIEKPGEASKRFLIVKLNKNGIKKILNWLAKAT